MHWQQQLHFQALQGNPHLAVSSPHQLDIPTVATENILQRLSNLNLGNLELRTNANKFFLILINHVRHYDQVLASQHI